METTTESRPSEGAELAMTMAESCASCGELDQALAHLDGVSATREPLPEKWESARREWRRRLRRPAPPGA